jgi:hypothetical protein
MAHWQKIDIKNLAKLEHHYLQFEPYCHLNIADMWGWRVDQNHWFKIGDTVVYRLNDYNDDSLYLTILGKSSAKRAIQELCRENKKLKKITLKCVPEVTLKALGAWDAIIKSAEDPDNHDYIFDIESLVNFSSPQLRHKYPHYRKLLRKHPDLKVKVLDHNKAADRRLIYKIFKKWVSQTNSQDWQKELLALRRILNLRRGKMVCLGFFDGRKAIGYTVNEPEKSGYYQAFSGKARRGYGNLSLFMEHETAKYIHSHYGSRFINLQPDQGLEGLRQYKTSLGPLRHLKKYIVVIDTAKALG